MDSCQRFKEMVSDYIEGGIDHQNQLIMTQHLRDCLRCKKNISQLKNLIQNLHDLPRIKVTPDFETILHARISMESSLARHRREGWFSIGQLRMPAYALVAIILMMAVISVLVLNKSNHYSAPQANINSEWVQGGAEKYDPTTNERYIYIIETQPVPNVNSQTSGENYQPGDQKTYTDSIQTFKDNKLWYETAQVLESKIY